METALNEITLVLFTTLAPAGAMAYVLMALPFIMRGASMDAAARRRLDNFLSLPVVVAMVGLVASATHLGNPANALYVVSGFGRSPLSNEVVCGVAFLGCAGVFWLTSFAEEARHLTLRRVMAAIISLLGLVFIGTISLAYNASTIIAWNVPVAPISLWLNALASGPLLAILGFRMARFSTPGHTWGRILVALAACAVIADAIVYAMWGALLPTLQNALTSAADLAPAFGPTTALFAMLSATSVILGAKSAAWDGPAPLWLPITAAGIMLAGIFLMRFMFYMTHMTVGLGV
ncbi:dimethyl sulfoxide reductase anchor subunit family protein [Adlercreutzia murintestinalis]|uniref:dimethyl sulfoxide reductase anchor subunit family protein n=1 Tax=Adlercreutzia murintestinalis TaxID=2941325 RepID=UPI00203D6C38|nr:DmsC/YnfH family molybdoenzyme membrane anchor subunit [Adlercreutzia murintestinalis]